MNLILSDNTYRIYLFNNYSSFISGRDKVPEHKNGATVVTKNKDIGEKLYDLTLTLARENDLDLDQARPPN